MKTVLITGANTGIGFATAEAFIQDGHHVILACRNLQKAQLAQQALEKIGKGKVELIELDLNSLKSVRDTADQVIQKYEKIDILVNNAGLMTPTLESTAEGYEKQFGVNYLAHFLWTMKLLEVVKKSEQGRIIHLASMMHYIGRIRPEQFQVANIQKYHGVLAYGNSKLANLLFSQALAETLRGTHVTSNALHPGGVDSDIYRKLPKYQYIAIKLFLISPQKPAHLIKKIALDPAWAQRNGEYVSLQTPAFKSSRAKDPQLAQQLYQQSLDLLADYL